MPQIFETALIARGPGGAWTFLVVPFSVEAVFGTRARLPVAGTINGFPFRNSLMPEGDGTHSMTVSKSLQAGAKARAGETVRVVLDIDHAPRVVSIPDELGTLLKANPGIAKTFETLSPSHRKEFVDWIESAKKPATRDARAKKSLEMIAARKRIG